MEDWEKEFVPYELALRMKTLGFAEPCWCYFENNVFFDSRFLKDYDYFEVMSKKYSTYTLAPTFSQAFRWFRDKHDLVAAILPFQDIEDRVSLCYYYSIVDLDECKDEDILCNESSLGASDINFSSHPEAELACLNKLIEIVEQKKI